MAYDPSIRVIKASEQDALACEEIPVHEGDSNPPGEQVVSFPAGDGMFSFGIWRRVPQTGQVEPQHHEGPGRDRDAEGSKATWKALSPVKKFWAVYKEP